MSHAWFWHFSPMGTICLSHAKEVLASSFLFHWGDVRMCGWSTCSRQPRTKTAEEKKLRLKSRHWMTRGKKGLVSNVVKLWEGGWCSVCQSSWICFQVWESVFFFFLLLPCSVAGSTPLLLLQSSAPANCQSSGLLLPGDGYTDLAREPQTITLGLMEGTYVGEQRPAASLTIYYF